MSDDDRPRKTWKEIDRQRDKSQHRREERPADESKRGGQRGQKSYRSALDRLFESGKISELVEMKAPRSSPPDPAAESKLKLLAKIRKATGREEITKAANEYLESYEMPDDLEILTQILEHRDAARQLEAMQQIDRILEHSRPKRWRAMLGQLKLLRDIGYDDEITSLAAALIDKLERIS